MKISREEARQIITLASTDKAEKNIRNYLEMLDNVSSRVKRQTDFYNKSYKSLYQSYFSTFAGRYRDECVMEAYVTGLGYINKGADLDIAIQHGFKAGTNLHRTMAKEVLVDDFEYLMDQGAE